MSSLFTQWIKIEQLKIEQLKIERLKLKINDLPDYLAGIKLIQLSDFHYDGESLSDEILDHVITKVNQEEADLILLTGDYITSFVTPIYSLILRLKELNSRYGIYAILGNHDYYITGRKEKITKALEDVNIEVLWNAIAYPLGQEFPLIGLAEFWSQEFNPAPIFAQLSPNIPRLVLCHNPDSAAFLKSYRVDLQLSGHTHGGQIALPGIGALPAVIKNWGKDIPEILKPYTPILNKCNRVLKHWEWVNGHHYIGKNQLYINQGLGSYFPGRLFCPPEITVITLASTDC